MHRRADEPAAGRSGLLVAALQQRPQLAHRRRGDPRFGEQAGAQQLRQDLGTGLVVLQPRRVSLGSGDLSEQPIARLSGGGCWRIVRDGGILDETLLVLDFVLVEDADAQRGTDRA
jgi:hypothetical protein